MFRHVPGCSMFLVLSTAQIKSKTYEIKLAYLMVRVFNNASPEDSPSKFFS